MYHYVYILKTCEGYKKKAMSEEYKLKKNYKLRKKIKLKFNKNLIGKN